MGLTMAYKPRSAVPVSDLANAILDPVLRRRAGISVGLVQNWDEIVGPRLAEATRPQKIVWPRRLSEEDPFEPATLLIACSGFAAMRVQHETTQIIERVNAFLGFAAVGRVKIVQKAVSKSAPVRRTLPAPDAATTARIDRLTAGIEDDELRASLARLGASVSAARK